MQKIFLGQPSQQDPFDHLPDLSLREKVITVPLAIIIIVLGLFPQPVLNTSSAAVDAVLKHDFTPPENSDTRILTTTQSTEPDSGKGTTT